MIKKFARLIKKSIDKVSMLLIAKFKYKAIKHDLDCKEPLAVLKRNGYQFDIKEIDAIVHGDSNGIAVSEIAAVYKTSINNTFVIGIDKTFIKLKDRTQLFVLEHEIAHVTYGLDNPKNKIKIETIVDKAAALELGLSNKQVRNCLRDIKRNCRYISSHQVLNKRIREIN